MDGSLFFVSSRCRVFIATPAIVVGEICLHGAGAEARQRRLPLRRVTRPDLYLRNVAGPMYAS